MPQKLHERDISINTHVHMGRSIDLCVLRNACHELFCVFEAVYASGKQDANKITEPVDTFHSISLTERLTTFGGGFDSSKVTIESCSAERLQQEQPVRVKGR